MNTVKKLVIGFASIQTPSELSSRCNQIKNILDSETALENAEEAYNYLYNDYQDKFNMLVNTLQELEAIKKTKASSARQVNEFGFNNYVKPGVIKLLGKTVKHFSPAQLSVGAFTTWLKHENIIDKAGMLTEFGKNAYGCENIHRGVKGIKYTGAIINAYHSELLKDFDVKTNFLW